MKYRKIADFDQLPGFMTREVSDVKLRKMQKETVEKKNTCEQVIHLGGLALRMFN